MPIWLVALIDFVKFLIWGYEHEALVKKELEEIKPLQKTIQNDPTPLQERDPNKTGHYGGL